MIVIISIDIADVSNDITLFMLNYIVIIIFLRKLLMSPLYESTLIHTQLCDAHVSAAASV